MSLSIVLTSRQNFVWLSMQEIIPMLEECWRRAADPAHEVQVVDVDGLDASGFRAIVRQALRAKNLIWACFTPKLARVARALRNDCGVDARFIVHLHNQATIAGWPLRVWGPEFRADDVFISSCAADAEAMRRVVTGARIEVVPFCLLEEEPLPGPLVGRLPEALVYVGRISPQKNLHTLLIALREVALPLELFGGEDHLGSPNMGIENPTYGSELRAMAKALGVEDRVHFHGHLPRAEIQARLRAIPYVFVSPSLHSDENFGMAAFRALRDGMPAVLSDWGGHRDFARAFSPQVQRVAVHASPLGPSLEAPELSEALRRAASQKVGAPAIPTLYAPLQVSTRFREIARRERKPSAPLLFTELADQILARRSHFLADSPRRSKIFDSYADPLARPLFEAYGMASAQASGCRA